jgi:hypothetical protein
MTMKSEEMFRPIDLESSLGKIEDSQMNGTDDMDYEPVTNTCEESPFLKDSTNMAPYPIAESSAEIRERQRLNESVGKLLPTQALQFADGRPKVDWVPEDLEPVEHPVDDDDDFSITSEEEESLVEENVDFEEIEDRVSFWDSGVEQSSEQLHPSAVSFCSHAEASQI